MKKLARIYKWIIISILLQVIVLSYFNFVYFPGRGAIKTTMYESDDDSIENKSIRIPSDADKICVSFNGVFTAYKRGNNLIITDNKRKKTLKSISSSGGEITYYRWLPDRDMLIYSMKSPEGKKGQVKISTYDIGPELERSYPEIKGLPEDSTVVDIELSPYTNVVYAMIKTGTSSLKVYKYNIMDNLTLVMKTDNNVIIKETAYSDHLIYQKGDGKLTVRSGKSGRSSNISLKGKVILLAVDSEDNIYAGELDGEKKVASLRYGKFDQQAKTWKQIKLDAPVLPSDIFVTPNGTIYCATRKENHIAAFGDKIGKSYDGELLDVLDDYVVSKDGALLKLTAIK